MVSDVQMRVFRRRGGLRDARAGAHQTEAKLRLAKGLGAKQTVFHALARAVGRGVIMKYEDRVYSFTD